MKNFIKSIISKNLINNNFSNLIKILFNLNHIYYTQFLKVAELKEKLHNNKYQNNINHLLLKMALNNILKNL